MGGEGQRGFVLVLTLWVLAVITIAASYFAQRVHVAMDLARQSQEAAKTLVAFADTRADILFRLATVPMSFYGLGNGQPIALDNRPYAGAGGDIVRLQDETGLINVNFPQQTMLSRLLGQMGVSPEQQSVMIDTLLDYTDTDNFRRLNGAEAPQYAALGLPPPPNEWLVSPYQLDNIIGWRDKPALLAKLLPLVTVSRLGTFNPNTAPPQVLASLPGVSRQSAAEIVKMRRLKPLYGTAELPGYTAGSLDPEFFYFFSGSSIRITLQRAKIPWAIKFSVTLTPDSYAAPWRVDYYIKTSVTYPIGNVDKIQKLPALASAPSGIGQAP